MVAETLIEPKNPKMGGYRQTIPLPVKLKIRSLYIIQQLSPAEIGEKMGLTRQQVQGICYREKWQKDKRRAKLAFQQKFDARAKEEVAEIHEGFAIKTEELAMGILNRASNEIERTDENAARDHQAMSQTAKNYVGIARQVRGMDAERNAERTNGSTIIFIGALERVGDSRREEKRVTEIQATPIPQLPAPPANPA